MDSPPTSALSDYDQLKAKFERYLPLIAPVENDDATDLGPPVMIFSTDSMPTKTDGRR